MEKRNVIEQGRTPDFDKQAELDDVEVATSTLFKVTPLPEVPGPNRGGDAFPTPTDTVRRP